MPTNHYFNNLRATNEQNVIEDLTVEAIKIHGIDIYYLPRTITDWDRLLGEDPNSVFADNKQIEMYLETVNGFEGPQDLLSKFGLQVKDNATFIVSKKRFQKETGMLRPLEGDIIYFPLTKGFFEIKFVEHENPFYQLGKNYTFKLSVELFQFSEEFFRTGEKEIDNFAKGSEFTLYLTVSGIHGMTSGSEGSYVYQYANGNSITGGTADATATARIGKMTNNVIEIVDTVGRWYATDTSTTRYITLYNNSGYATVSAISDSLDISTNTKNDNNIIETDSDNILDFTKKNPFGTY